jgi:hypothetical protein
VTLAEAMAEFGSRPMAGGGRRGALAYLEAHIEQGRCWRPRGWRWAW